MKIKSPPFANILRISLETELRNLQASQQSVRVDSGATMTLMTQRMELLDRLVSLMEQKTILLESGQNQEAAGEQTARTTASHVTTMHKQNRFSFQM